MEGGNATQISTVKFHGVHNHSFHRHRIPWRSFSFCQPNEIVSEQRRTNVPTTHKCIRVTIRSVTVIRRRGSQSFFILMFFTQSYSSPPYCSGKIKILAGVVTRDSALLACQYLDFTNTTFFSLLKTPFFSSQWTLSHKTFSLSTPGVVDGRSKWGLLYHEEYKKVYWNPFLKAGKKIGGTKKELLAPPTHVSHVVGRWKFKKGNWDGEKKNYLDLDLVSMVVERW